LFLEICLLLLIEWMFGDIVFFVFKKKNFGFEFSVHAMLCLQLADGVWPSLLKGLLTYLLTSI